MIEAALDIGLAALCLVAVAIMIAPVPTTELWGCSVQMADKQPDFLFEATRAVEGKYAVNTVQVMREVNSSPDATDEQFAAFQPLVQNESLTAVMEMMAMAQLLPKSNPKISALVIRGELDALFAANLLHFTAAGWNAETCVIPRAGHMLIMEPQWTAGGEKIELWLASRLS